MTQPFRMLEGSVTSPRGFSAAGVFCDIKRMGTGKGSNKGQKRDLAILLSDVPAAAAGMFTTNQVCAAPVKVCIKRIGSGMARAVVVNSGNANACTGQQGFADALEMARCAASALDLPQSSVLVASTGRIGVPMPMDRVRDGIMLAAGQLGQSREQASAAAEAIMTSDTRPKESAVAIQLRGKTVRIGGMCKGAGMIAPGMSRTGKRPAAQPRGLHATMLGFLTTDAAVEPHLLQAMLEEAVAASFNQITVDGDMSTNDTVLLLANGQAGNPAITSRSARADKARFQSALNAVCLDLARKIVADGEGVHRVVTVIVSGARTDADADAVARSVANSALVKTSWHGGDPNWGRIIDAVGYSAAKVVEERIDIGYSTARESKVVFALRRGQPTPIAFRELCRLVAGLAFNLHIDLHLGRGRAVMHAADLTEAYVDFNKGDVSDPASLGG